MTIDQVKSLSWHDTIHYTGPGGRVASQPCTRTVGPRGGVKESIITVRLNGAVKTWKRDPNRVSVPFKYGLYEYGYITEANCEHFHLGSDCPLVKEDAA